MLQVRLANPGEYTEIESFYKGQGYSSSLNETDLVIVATEEEKVVGAVRICQEEGLLVLRGMYVLECKQGAGIGSSLLTAARAKMCCRECWCIPYTHLNGFYSQAGFIAPVPGSEPPFLLDRLAKYLEHGKSVELLVKPGN